MLQTLPALRVRLVTTIGGLKSVNAPDQLAQLQPMEELVTAEQAHLRRLLSATEMSVESSVDLGVAVERCCRFITLQWDVGCPLTPLENAVTVSGETAAEVEFLIREAAANAVKHAAARHITISLAQADAEILIALKDNPGTEPVVRQAYTGDFELHSQSIMRRLGEDRRNGLFPQLKHEFTYFD